MPYQVRSIGIPTHPADYKTEYAEVDKRGALIVVPQHVQAALEGRMFIVTNAAKQTALAVGGTSYSDTAPAFVLDVPLGTTVPQIKVRLRQGGTVAGGVINVYVTADSVARYSSGGTLFTARNMRDDQPRASNCVFYSAPTLAAVTTDLLLKGQIVDQDVATAPSATATIFDYPDPGEPSYVLVGPASLIVYSYAASTQPSWFFQFIWEEYPSDTIV